MLLRLVSAEHSDLFVKHVDDGLQLRVVTLHYQRYVIFLVAILHHLCASVVVGLLSIGIETVKEQSATLSLLIVG